MEKIEVRNRDEEIFAVITKSEHNPWVYVQWMGQIDDETLKKGILKISEAIEHFKCPYILSDRRIAQGNWFNINNWLQHKWAPVAIRAGLQYLAHVTAPIANSHLASQDLESRILGFNFKSFESLEKAEDWLHEIISQSS